MSQEKEASVNPDFKKYINENIPLLESTDDFAGVSQLRAELAKVTSKKCEHCSSEGLITSGCPYCGAPVCCPVCCRIQRLEDELAKVKAERDEARGQKEQWEKLCVGIAESHSKLKTEIARLKAFEDWVERSGTHTSICAKLDLNSGCTCGLDALLNQKEAK